MKATIRYTKIKALRKYTDGRVVHVAGSDEPFDDAIVRVTEITHCEPFRKNDGPGSTIFLTDGRRLNTATTIDELERRIEAAEAAQTATQK